MVRRTTELPAAWAGVASARAVALTTFKRDGSAVTTPMWTAADGGRILTTADFDAGKLKRLRHTSRVQLAPCTIRGRVTGPAVEGVAHVLDDVGTKDAIAAKRRRYVSFRLMVRFRKRQVGVSITPP